MNEAVQLHHNCFWHLAGDGRHGILANLVCPINGVEHDALGTMVDGLRCGGLAPSGSLGVAYRAELVHEADSVGPLNDECKQNTCPKEENAGHNRGANVSKVLV